jgi:hypothetical protein
MCQRLFSNQLSSRPSLGKDTRGERRRQIKKQRRYRVLIAPVTRKKEREERKARGDSTCTPSREKRDRGITRSLCLFVENARARYTRTFTVLYVNKSSLKSAQRAPKPIAAKTKAKTKEERFLLFYGVRLLGIFVKTDRHQRKEKRCPGRGKNLRLRLVNVSFD